ncbi:MAG: amidohydrolase [Phycisphaerales bacterium]|nr:amidohydrolase [Phycisphaerales bacterium]
MATHTAGSGLRPVSPVNVTVPLKALIEAELPDLIRIRRDLHRHPELSFQEHRTSRFIQEELTRLGIAFKAGLGRGTGIVAHLPASDPADSTRPAVALRADMDALPIDERTGRPYASGTPGVMHACGHDGHTTILLGAARILSKVRRPCPVTLIFQPAEENGGGGQVMCDEGVLLGDRGAGLGPAIGRIFGLHGWPQLPLGHVATRAGAIMAATDDFELTIRGTQTHGAYPHLGFDSILASAHIITALQSIAARNVGPLESIVVTVGQIEGGTANNIIPESVRMIGTIRTLNDQVKARARERFFAVVEQTAAALGCRAEIDWQPGYPVTSNDPALTDQFFDIARQALGRASVFNLEQPTMGGEDFAFYGKCIPSCFFFMGLKPAGASDYPSLHQPEFDFNDDALAIGIDLFCRVATAEP